jgi:hypothetical protein
MAKLQKTPEYAKTVNYLRENLFYEAHGRPFYHRYYMAQALLQCDEALWEKWNHRNISFLVRLQNRDGSFPSIDHPYLHGKQSGNVYSTSMALLSLAVNYRFLPIYER